MKPRSPFIALHSPPTSPQLPRFAPAGATFAPGKAAKAALHWVLLGRSPCWVEVQLPKSHRWLQSRRGILHAFDRGFHVSHGDSGGTPAGPGPAGIHSICILPASPQTILNLRRKTRGFDPCSSFSSGPSGNSVLFSTESHLPLWLFGLSVSDLRTSANTSCCISASHSRSCALTRARS